MRTLRLAAFCLGLLLAGIIVAEPFRVEGNRYIAQGEALGADEASALEAAKSAALRTLFAGLKKDGLFAEIFVREPPLGLEFKTASMVRDGAKLRAVVQLSVDDESIRIVERGPYLQAATSLLDGAERNLRDAETLIPQAEVAETGMQLGTALSRYGQVLELSRGGLELLAALESGSIFSSQGGRGLLDLRAALQSLQDRSNRGIGRIKEAENALERDEASRNLGTVVEAALAEVERAEALLSQESAALADPTAIPQERLMPLRDRIAVRRSAIRDADVSLARARKTFSPGPGYLADKLDFADRRMATASRALAAAYASVDREIRDPAARRAARARFFRSILLHEPGDYLQLRAFLPISIDLGDGGLSLPSAPFEFRARAEGAIGTRSGVWIRTGFQGFNERLSSTELYTLSQQVDFGFWGRSLFWAGYSWDWMRRAEGENLLPLHEITIGIGGVGALSGDRRRASWLLGLSAELPRERPDSLLDLLSGRYLNGGLEGLFRLGQALVLEGELFARHREMPLGLPEELLLGYRLALGLRLPPPVLWGAELRGGCSGPGGGSDGFDELVEIPTSLRIFVEYDL